MSTFGLQSRHLTRCCSWQASSQARLQQSSRSASSLSSAVVQPMAPIFNRREKKKLRNSFPRPDKSPQVLHPALPPSFVNRVTMADGSSFYLTTRSPRPSIALARDVTNHPLWNPSLAREESTESLESQSDPQSTEQETQNQASQPKQPEVVNQSQSALDKHGFGVDDLQWISGESKQSFYGVGNARNIRGMKKVWVKK
ncbi:hypothetical protein PSTT_06534 [Puccinia striiformis]|uniref:50S ribosomal protein L31, chloroplastic n=1 Tax=Puccinia striiformis TaxID=27350 RepID=A0A2S4VJZ6_9BASI|nr:hypothetical protein PSTT_06534 [Puccinia striiformis]